MTKGSHSQAYLDRQKEILDLVEASPRSTREIAKRYAEKMGQKPTIMERNKWECLYTKVSRNLRELHEQKKVKRKVDNQNVGPLPKVMWWR